ncbi:MAG: glutathione S-transferase family protein [Beijerinckiaceae bacterium]
MIQLHVFGADLGLADPSPFVAKAMTLLKIAGLAFEPLRADVRKSPKHKLPVIVDDGITVPDSTFIRFHIEKKYGFDFDKGLSEEQKAIAWAVEKMLEEHVYWIAMYDRWAVEKNFQAGPARFFNVLPAPLRPFIKSMVRKHIIKNLDAHGMGRHAPDEMAQLGERAIASVPTILGDKPYFMGDAPCGADATVYAFMASGACPVFDSRLRTAIESRANIMAYIERINAQYFPELTKAE